LNVRVFGAAGAPLKAVFTADGETVTVRSEPTLAPATTRALTRDLLREQLGRLGDTPFVLAALDDAALGAGLFLPVSALNRLRQDAVAELLLRRDWARGAVEAERDAAIDAAIARIDTTRPVELPTAAPFALRAVVYTAEDARAAAEAGATEIVFDPFLRHPAPPRARVVSLRDELAARGVGFRLRTPSIVRPEERPQLQKWLDLGLPLLSGHLGLVAEQGSVGRDVVADYAVNCFNQHTAAELFASGAGRVTVSLELTADEMAATVAPWNGRGFDVFLYGRPEGMTIEHCVLSAAFDREPTTCRDLCVQKHTNVLITDPTGYTFPVATDSACRNRLLHSRPVDGSEYLPKLWASGIRGYQMVFNVAGDRVGEIVRRYRMQLDALASGGDGQQATVREVLGTAFTRGHFARAV
jgi:putative protease